MTGALPGARPGGEWIPAAARYGIMVIATRAIGAVGSALPSHGRGHQFESGIAHQHEKRPGEPGRFRSSPATVPGFRRAPHPLKNDPSAPPIFGVGAPLSGSSA